jgi:hypothetical protein
MDHLDLADISDCRFNDLDCDLIFRKYTVRTYKKNVTSELLYNKKEDSLYIDFILI